jgi:hypothetical protein
MIDPDQYDGFATPEELNLTQEEIEDLRNNKRKLTDYGMKRIKELMRNQEPYPDEMLSQVENQK